MYHKFDVAKNLFLHSVFLEKLNTAYIFGAHLMSAMPRRWRAPTTAT
jgi:hypothetical protein